jgi:hypothetical protein
MTTKSPVELRDSSTQTMDEYPADRSSETEPPSNRPPQPESSKNFPYTKAVVGGIVCAILTIFVFPVGLFAVGFTALGPAAGSLAAAWMSSIGVVKAGSIYSVIQSTAMGGAYAATVKGIAAVVTGVATTLGLAWLLPQPSGNGTDSSTQTDAPPTYN